MVNAERSVSCVHLPYHYFNSVCSVYGELFSTTTFGSWCTFCIAVSKKEEKKNYRRLLFARREDTCDLLTQAPKFIFLIRQLRALRRGSAVARFLESWARIPLTAWIFFYFVCCVLSGGFCASGWSLVQRSPTECGVCNECGHEAL
jgi:hypothetical protein